MVGANERWRPVALAVIGAALLVASADSTAEEQLEIPQPLDLGWCLERAAAANPELAAQAAGRDAADQRIVPAGALDDPRVAYDAVNLPTGRFDTRSTPMSGHQFGLKQRFPFPGLLRNRERAAGAAAQAASADLDDLRTRVAGRVEQQWAQLGFAQRALAITDRNVELLRQLATIAEARYKVGAGLQQDVLRAQVELTALLDDRLQRVAALEAAVAALAATLDLPDDTRFPPTSALTDTAEIPETAALLAALEQHNPRLAAARARIEQARRQLRATELEGYPDFDLGVGYRVRQRAPGDPVKGDDFVGAGVTLRLPVDRAKWRARSAEQRALVRRAEAEYRRIRAELRAQVRSLHADLVRSDRQAELLGTGLVPQAEQSLDSSRSGYEVGRVDFLSLLDSQVRLLDAELRHVRALAGRRSAFAALEAALGEKLR